MQSVFRNSNECKRKTGDARRICAWLMSSLVVKTSCFRFSCTEFPFHLLKVYSRVVWVYVLGWGIGETIMVIEVYGRNRNNDENPL